MSSAQNLPKSSRISAIFKRQRGGSSSMPNQHLASVNQDESESAIPTSDKERMRERHLKAMSLLEDALKVGNEMWGNFEILKLEGELENVNLTEFKEKLEALCQSYSQKRNCDRLAQCVHVVERCFRVFSPFAKNFLSIAKEAAQVVCSAFVADFLRYQYSIRTGCFLVASSC